MIAFLTALFGLIKLIISLWFDKNAETAKKKKEVVNEAIEGVEKNDCAAITAALDKLNRV